MLSYQHIYHAGNLADVHKHMALSVVLERLMTANKPLTYIETHAGRGLYDLSSKEAQKTKEAELGIKSLMPKMPKTHAFAKVQDATKKKYGKNFYAGSPYIARSILAKSQLHLFELHPQEFVALSQNISGVNLHNKNGYDGTLKLCPPKERRGLVLIDPSYEIKTEYEDATKFVFDLHKKWKEAVILLWYPILDAGHHAPMVESLEGCWMQEIMFKDTARIRGSGLIGVNLRAETVKELEKIPAVFE